MARRPQPFYRTARKAFYCQLGTNQVKLAAGPNDAATEALAWAAFHKVMVAPPDSSVDPAVLAVGMSVVEVFDKFLDWCQKHRSLRIYEWSRGHAQSFIKHTGLLARSAVAVLKPFHVQEWLDSKPTWGANQRRGAVVAVTRPFNWATKLGYVAANPVRGVERPQAERRVSKLTPDDFRVLLSHVKNEPFRDLLTFAYECGVRPQEARQIEARHCRLDLGRVEIPPAEAKGKRRWRIIDLSDAARDCPARLAATQPIGPLFRNTDGQPWKAQAVVCRFQRLLVKLGAPELPAIKRFQGRAIKDPAARAAAKAAHQVLKAENRNQRGALARENPRRFAMYDIRHCFATRKLKEGHDPITVAALAFQECSTPCGDTDGFTCC